MELQTISHRRTTHYIERFDEISQITNALSNAKKGRGTGICLSGTPGTGKTGLVKHVINRAEEDNILFAHGKFGQFGNSQPYAALVQAIEKLTDAIMLESDSEFSKYQAAFKSALGENGSVISNVVPKFSSVIGALEKPLLLGATETRNRFYHVVEEFFQVFVRLNKTLVIFFDDLQWADVASLELIENLLTSSWSKQALFVVSFRSDEINNNLSLVKLYASLEKRGVLTTLELENFTEHNIKKYIDGNFYQPIQRYDELVTFLSRATGGNPLYLSHYINKQVHDKNLWLNSRENYWEWNFSSDDSAAESITNYLDTSLEGLEKEELGFLQYGFCLREQFCLNEVSASSGLSASKVKDIAGRLEAQDYITTEGDVYHFRHDRILRSVKDISTKKALAEIRLKIVKVLLRTLSKDELDSRLEEVVDYLNEVQPSLTEVELKYTLAANKAVFEKAIYNGAYSEALPISLKMLEVFDRLNDGSNINERFLYLFNVSRSYYLNGKFDLAKLYINEAFENATTFDDELKIYSVFKDIIISESGRYEDILEKGRELLKKIDIIIPSNMSEMASVILEAQNRVDGLLGKNNIATLIDHVELKNKTIQGVLVLLNDLWEAAYYAGDEQMMQYIVLINVEISLKNGNSSESAFGFVMAGMLETLQGNYDKAYDMGELAINLVDKYNDEIMLPKVTNLFCNYISPYRNPFSHSASLYHTSAVVGRNNGDYLFGLWATLFEIWSRFLSGENLTHVLDVAIKSEKFILQTNDTKIIYIYTVLKDILLSMIEQDKEKNVLRGYGDFIEYWQQENFLPGITWLNILLGQYYCMFGDFEKANRLFTQKGLNTSPGLIMFPYAQFIFYSAHAALRFAISNNTNYKDSDVNVDNHIEILDSWRCSSADNFEYQYYILLAERNRASGQYWDALQLFNQAISSAEKHGNNYAIAYSHEMKANFMMASNDIMAGAFHLQLSSNHYQEWGCHKKANLISADKKATDITTRKQTRNDKRGGNRLVNIDEIIKFNKVLSQEFNEDKIIGEALNILTKITRADKGGIITKEGETFLLKAVADKKLEFAIHYVNDDIKLVNNIPVSLIRYVVRSKNILNIDDLNASENNYDNEYFSRTNANSLLCLPVVHKGKVQLILYLESTGVLGQQDESLINTVDMLLYQLYSSLNNAQLYHSLSEESIKLKNTADMLEVSENRFSLSTKYSEVGIWEWNIITGELYWSEMVGPMFGGDSEEIETSYENFVNLIHPEDKIKVENAIQTCFDGQEYNVEHRVVWKDGTIRWIQESGDVLRDESGKPIKMLGTARDITEYKENQEARVNLEKQLQRAQKMDALGKLTGGIAHDYNNILGIIQGYAELLSKDLHQNPKLEKYSQDIYHAAKRGAKLTRKLLVFARHQASENSVIDLNDILETQRLMLEKTLTVSIDIVFDLDSDLWPVELNKSDLEDMIVNISINAAHAMPTGGRVTFRTINCRLDAFDAKQVHLDSGDYVLLTITDTGCGMDNETLEKIFDPFYTTKGDIGTGLGLSQVYGFIERIGGSVQVYSELGHGSRFALYFPRSEKTTTVETQAPSSKTQYNLQGKETLLVVDDEQSMTELAKDILSRQGYHVLTAMDGEQALEILDKHPVDMLVSDVVMPNMDGYELAAIVQQQYPKIKIQMVSGFADQRYKNISDAKSLQNILYKPYTSALLLQRIRSLLDGPKTKKTLSKCRLLVMDDDEDTRALYKINLEKLGCSVILTADSHEAIERYKKSVNDNVDIDIAILDLSIPGNMDGIAVADKIREVRSDSKIIVASGHTESGVMKNYGKYGFQGALEKNFDRKKMKDVLEQVLLAD